MSDPGEPPKPVEPSGPPNPTELSEDRLSASVDEIERAIDNALGKLEADRKAEAALHAEASIEKTGIGRRVSIAALLLTMMLSFLGFVRAKSDYDESSDKLIVQQSSSEAATEWSLYQTKTAQRSGFIEAEDALAREVLSLPVADPRRRLARFHHHEYEAKVRQLDDDNVQVFHRVQGLNRREYLARKDADHHQRRTERYDMGIRTLTLALVLISVTLLVERMFLLWFGLLIAAIGAALGVTGYFLR